MKAPDHTDSRAAAEECDDMRDWRPKLGDEVLVTLKAKRLDGSVMDDRPPMEYQIGSNDLGPISAACEKLVLGMKVGDEEQVDIGPPAHDGATLTLTLDKIYHTQDVSFAKNLAIVKKRLTAGKECEKPADSAKVKLSVDTVTDGFSALTGFESAVLDFTLGNGEVCDVLEFAAREMSKGERAMLKIATPALAVEPRLGLANLSAERVVFYVELVDFDQALDPRCLSLEDLLVLARSRKEVGTVLFKKGRLELAHQRYADIVELLNLKADGDTTAKELQNVCRLNMATCLVKLQGFASAKEACDLVLQEEPENIKALYRRAQAELGLESFVECIRDCKRVIGVDANNKEARALLTQAQESHQKSKRLFA